MSFKTQMPLQEKIAELERRIVDLEARFKGAPSLEKVDLVHSETRWRSLWKAFDEFFDWEGKEK